MIKEQLKTLIQYLIPQHGLSLFMGNLADKEHEALKNWAIQKFIKQYQVDMSIAVEPDPKAYKSFNDFFTRAIRPEVRPLCTQENMLVSPVDGAISQLGSITEGRIIQAKNHSYTVSELLGGDKELSQNFQQGQFCTIYLSPKDYHRIHMPFTGKLEKMLHIPGKLFSVNPLTARTVPNLFARNERVVTVFDTSFGKMIMVAVGATIVGSIETVWAGTITPPTKKNIQTSHYDGSLSLKKGEEMGRFKLGSTVILLLPSEQSFAWQSGMIEKASVNMGEALTLWTKEKTEPTV